MSSLQLYPQKTSSKWAVIWKVIREMESPWLVDHKSGIRLKHHSNTRRKRASRSYAWKSFGFRAGQAASGHELRLARFLRVFEWCLSLIPLLWSTSQWDSISVITFHIIAHLLLVFVGKVAVKTCFSTHKMCDKSEHQKCMRYEKWILLAEYIAKVLWYAKNTQLIVENCCFEVGFWSWAGISVVIIENFWVLSRNSL